jgi:hypothetical protein
MRIISLSLSLIRWSIFCLEGEKPKGLFMSSYPQKVTALFISPEVLLRRLLKHSCYLMASRRLLGPSLGHPIGQALALGYLDHRS